VDIYPGRALDVLRFVLKCAVPLLEIPSSLWFPVKILHGQIVPVFGFGESLEPILSSHQGSCGFRIVRTTARQICFPVNLWTLGSLRISKVHLPLRELCVLDHILLRLTRNQNPTLPIHRPPIPMPRTTCNIFYLKSLRTSQHLRLLKDAPFGCNLSFYRNE
jgi:hypothetical protein